MGIGIKSTAMGNAINGKPSVIANMYIRQQCNIAETSPEAIHAPSTLSNMFTMLVSGLRIIINPIQTPNARISILGKFIFSPIQYSIK